MVHLELSLPACRWQHDASAGGYEDIVSMLLDAGAGECVNHQDNDGETPLVLPLTCGRLSYEILDLCSHPEPCMILISIPDSTQQLGSSPSKL